MDGRGTDLPKRSPHPSGCRSTRRRLPLGLHRRPRRVVLPAILRLARVHDDLDHAGEAAVVVALRPVGAILALAALGVRELLLRLHPHDLPLVSLNRFEPHCPEQSPDGHRLSNLRYFVRVVDHEAANGVVVSFRQLYTKLKVDVVDLRGRRHEVAALAHGLDLLAPSDTPRRIIHIHIRVIDLTNNLLEDVFQRHQAGRSTVLIHANRDRPLLQLLQQAQDRHSFGHEERRVADVLHDHRLPVRAAQIPHPLQQRLHADNANDRVKPVLVNWKPAVLSGGKLLLKDGDGITSIDARHVDKGYHDVVHALAVQVSDATDHLALFRLQNACLNG
mmetsp:Transcript_72712/g.164983  ORF Transcript_72712/g.164983 Transcript_72712/m.164983 type:complete len:333 (+) Transcript_72712:152-1150(+)